MGRPKQYQSSAEKQAAYRARLDKDTVIVDRRVLDAHHRDLEELREAVYQAQCRGDEFARQCSAKSVQSMIHNMTDTFNERCTAVLTNTLEDGLRKEVGN